MLYKRTVPRIELKSLRRKPELPLTSFLVIIFASKRFLIDSACVSYQDFFGNEIKLLLHTDDAPQVHSHCTNDT